jgi:hypothetical protein
MCLYNNTYFLILLLNFLIFVSFCGYLGKFWTKVLGKTTKEGVPKGAGQDDKRLRELCIPQAG